MLKLIELIEINEDVSFKYTEVIKAGSDSKLNHRSIYEIICDAEGQSLTILCFVVLSLVSPTHKPCRLLTDLLMHIAHKTAKHYLALLICLADFNAISGGPGASVHLETKLFWQDCYNELLWRRINY